MDKKTGILLVNLGTPDTPSNSDVYKYLIEFLTDERVIDFGWWKRNLLVRGAIVPARYKNSAKTYREIWDKERGSPLLYHLQDLAAKVQQQLGNDFVVEYAMRYQNPSLQGALEKLQKLQVNKIVVLPLFPQYSSACNGSVLQRVQEITSSWQTIPDIKLIHHFYDNAKFIDAFVARGNEHNFEDFDHVLFSYHGLPARQLQKADLSKKHCLQDASCCASITEINQHCYKAQCYATTKLIVDKLGLSKDKYTVTFQSRLGKEIWLEPYTVDVIPQLGKAGKKKLLIFSPAFVADCLETLYEIRVEYLELFEQYGGEHITLVESLNSEDNWVDAVCDIVTT
ncbi:MAG TPA: ferrochelatase [Chitinophagales bacterium]|nr:ferrochelatase [Chitinophagales bacterium]